MREAEDVMRLSFDLWTESALAEFAEHGAAVPSPLRS
jgi:hypothetical protein